MLWNTNRIQYKPPRNFPSQPSQWSPCQRKSEGHSLNRHVLLCSTWTSYNRSPTQKPTKTPQIRNTVPHNFSSDLSQINTIPLLQYVADRLQNVFCKCARDQHEVSSFYRIFREIVKPQNPGSRGELA